MTSNDTSIQTGAWYRTSPKNLALFTLIWLGEFLLTVLFFKWLLHASAKIYLVAIPWVLLGAIMVFRPNWITRFTEVFELNSDRLNKWNPPGFP